MGVFREEQKIVQQLLQRHGKDIKDFHDPSLLATSVYLFVLWGMAGAVAALWFSAGVAGKIALFLALGFVQHGLANAVHQASHYCLARGKRWNDFLGDVFFALPLGITVASYRLTHNAHHQLLGEKADPASFVFRRDLPTRKIVANLLFLLGGRVGFELLQRVIRGRHLNADRPNDRIVETINRRRVFWVLAAHLPVAAAAYFVGGLEWWVVWVVCVMTWTPFLDGIRTIVEHRALPGDHPDFHTRSHHSNTVVSVLMAPLFYYHWEHHLYPGIPHYRLASLHRLLVRAGLKQALPYPGGFFHALHHALTTSSAKPATSKDANRRAA